MNLDAIATGSNPPEDVNVIIEGLIAAYGQDNIDFDGKRSIWKAHSPASWTDHSTRCFRALHGTLSTRPQI
jgi:hypothetical protein